MRRRFAPNKIIIGFATITTLMVSAGIPVAVFHKSPDPVYYLGITMVYIAAAFAIAGLLLLMMRLIRRIAASNRFRDHVGPAYHASVKLSVRFWSDSGQQASLY
jgi:hypothetical protein